MVEISYDFRQMAKEEIWLFEGINPPKQRTFFDTTYCIHEVLSKDIKIRAILYASVGQCNQKCHHRTLLHVP